MGELGCVIAVVVRCVALVGLIGGRGRLERDLENLEQSFDGFGRAVYSVSLSRFTLVSLIGWRGFLSGFRLQDMYMNRALGIKLTIHIAVQSNYSTTTERNIIHPTTRERDNRLFAS